MRTSLAIACIFMVTSGCMASRSLKPGDTLAPDANVSITFARPRDFDAKRDTATHALRSVRKLHGRVEHIRSDSLVLRVVAFESRVRQPELRRSVRLAVMPDVSDSITIRHFSRGRTAAAVSGIALLGLLALLLTNMELDFTCTTCQAGY